MSRWKVVLGILASVWFVDATAQVPSLVGEWTWTRSVNSCTEVYDYRADGTFSVSSGEELASGSYEISKAPDDNGFYTLKGRTLKTNGGRDCSDSGTQPTDYEKPYTVYLIFHRTQPLHLVCKEPSLQLCFGPLRGVSK